MAPASYSPTMTGLGIAALLLWSCWFACVLALNARSMGLSPFTNTLADFLTLPATRSTALANYWLSVLVTALVTAGLAFSWTAAAFVPTRDIAIPIAFLALHGVCRLGASLALPDLLANLPPAELAALAAVHDSECAAAKAEGRAVPPPPATDRVRTAHGTAHAFFSTLSYISINVGAKTASNACALDALAATALGINAPVLSGMSWAILASSLSLITSVLVRRFTSFSVVGVTERLLYVTTLVWFVTAAALILATGLAWPF